MMHDGKHIISKKNNDLSMVVIERKAQILLHSTFKLNQTLDFSTKIIAMTFSFYFHCGRCHRHRGHHHHYVRCHCYKKIIMLRKTGQAASMGRVSAMFTIQHFWLLQRGYLS